MSFSKRNKVAFMVIAFAVFVIVLIYAVMLLWNWLMPELFGLSMITYWQALGLLALSKILFGCGMHKKHCSHCHKSEGGCRNMSSHEKQSWKEKFMEKWSNCHAEESKPSEDKEDTITPS